MVDQPKSFQPLRISRLLLDTGYARPRFIIPNPVKASSSTREVMTDLQFIHSQPHALSDTFAGIEQAMSTQR